MGLSHVVLLLSQCLCPAVYVCIKNKAFEYIKYKIYDELFAGFKSVQHSIDNQSSQVLCRRTLVKLSS